MLGRVTRSTTAATQAAANTPSQISTSSGSHSSLTGPTSLQARNSSRDYICLRNFHPIRQTYDNSCWAAVTAMAQQIVDPNPKVVFTEEMLITRLAAWTSDRKDAIKTSVSVALKTANLKVEEEVADAGSIIVRPTIGSIYNSINAGQPLIMCLTGKDQSTAKNIRGKDSHYVLVTGCTQLDNIIEITNPSDGMMSLHEWNRNSGQITLTTDRYPGTPTEVKSYYSSLTYYIEPPSPSASASSSSTPANPSTSSSSTSVSASSKIP